MVAVIEGGDRPDLVLFPQTYEGRDVMARLRVKLDRTVLTNNTEIVVDGERVAVTTPIFGGNTLVTTTFTGGGAGTGGVSSRRAFAEPDGHRRPVRCHAPVPDWGRRRGARSPRSHVEESSGPKLDEATVVVVGWPWAR